MRPLDAGSLVGRVLFGGFFLVASANHFMDTATLAAAAQGQGVPFPTFAILATGLLLLVGGASIVLGIAPRIGLLCIMIFLVGVTPVMHDFWNLTDPAAQAQQVGFFLRNIALLGAALSLAVIETPWPLSIGGLARRAVRARRPETRRPV